MADFDPFSHGKYWCPYLDERIWTEFSKRIRPGAHRARIAILTFSCMCREYILYVQRTYCMCREYIFLRTIYFQKTTFYIFFQNLSIPKISAARSRQIAELEGLAYTPKRAERPTYWNGYPAFFQRIQESRVIAFSVEKRRKTPKVTDLPKCGMSTMFFLKNTLLKNSVYYI